MKKIIHRLRRQPEEVRRHILHIAIFITAIVMLILWIFSLERNLTNPDTQTKMKQDLQPFSTFKNNLVGGNTNTNSSN